MTKRYGIYRDRADGTRVWVAETEETGVPSENGGEYWDHRTTLFASEAFSDTRWGWAEQICRWVNEFGPSATPIWRVGELPDAVALSVSAAREGKP